MPWLVRLLFLEAGFELVAAELALDGLQQYYGFVLSHRLLMDIRARQKTRRGNGARASFGPRKSRAERRHSQPRLTSFIAWLTPLARTFSMASAATTTPCSSNSR